MSGGRWTMHPVVARPFYQAARELGLPVDEGLRSLGISPRGDGEGARLAHAQGNDLLQLAVELSGRPDFGLLAARAVQPGDLDLVELATRSQRTVAEAITTLSSLVAILHDGARVSLERGDDVSVLRVALGDGGGLHPAGYDFIAASLLIAARRQIDTPEVDLRSVDLPYPRPAVTDYLEAFFETELHFDADVLQARFGTAALDRPLLRSDARAGRVLAEAARELLPRDAAPRTASKVADVVRTQLGAREVTLATVARALAVSERTLRRRLQDEGETFRGVLDGVRHELALEALDDPGRSTEQVASDLGFSTAQAFHRAFRRWTGQTVQAYRSGRRGGADKP